MRAFDVAHGGSVVLKIGGELIETPGSRDRIAAGIAALAIKHPLVVIHGGGKAIDREMTRRGISPRKVDGLRVTDAETLDAVVAVLAGSANTLLVAACVAAGVRAVGLTGVDAGCARATRALPMRSVSGDSVDLGLVGDPEDVDPALIELLMTRGYVPVIASLGFDATRHSTHEASGTQHEARVLNVNADVMACRVAAAIGARDLVIAGTTAGVLSRSGETLPVLHEADVDALVASGTANAGMVTKLGACLEALDSGVARVRIVDGRAIGDGVDLDAMAGTTLTATAQYASAGLTR